MRVLDDWLLTPARAALHLPSKTAVVADLHLGYRAARCRAGEAVPLNDLASELAPLQEICERQDVHRLVVAGDLFEAGPEPSVVTDLLAWLLEARIDLVAVVPGNHDRDLSTSRLPVAADGFSLGKWQIVHGEGQRPRGPSVQGHEHPLFRWSERIQAPCFLVGRDHLVLPAYSIDAAGVNMLGDPRWRKYRCCALTDDAVLDFGTIEQLRPT